MNAPPTSPAPAKRKKKGYLSDKRPVLLDLFCGEGGAAMGYHRAGFSVVGVLYLPQPRYPFLFIQEDAMQYLQKYGRDFDVIHVSPPCQAYSHLTPNNLLKWVEKRKEI